LFFYRDDVDDAAERSEDIVFCVTSTVDYFNALNIIYVDLRYIKIS